MSNAQTRRFTAKPNIVFILADDMRKDDMQYMPKTNSLLREKAWAFGTPSSPTPSHGRHARTGGPTGAHTSW